MTKAGKARRPGGWVLRLLLLLEELQNGSSFAFGEGLHRDEEAFFGAHVTFILPLVIGGSGVSGPPLISA